jgi:glyoxylase-like metal-dependent hydrolase (beta-lactamase superfamily II)
MAYKIQTFIEPELMENTYVLYEPDGNAIVIDPGADAKEIERFLKAHGLNVGLILNTHGHADHIRSNAALRRATGAKIGVHELDAPMLRSALLCGALFIGWQHEEHEPDFLLGPGQTVGAGGILFEILQTPGHSVGSVCLYDRANGLLFGGDLIFQDSVGRWDLPGGNRDVLMRSIVEKILPLPDETVIYSGHGAATTIGREKKSNPYIAPLV